MSTGLSPYKPCGDRNLYMGVAHRTNQSRPKPNPTGARTEKRRASRTGEMRRTVRGGLSLNLSGQALYR